MLSPLVVINLLILILAILCSDYKQFTIQSETEIHILGDYMVALTILYYRKKIQKQRLYLQTM